MKLFITISLAMLLIFQTFNRAYYVIYYEVNKEYIAKYLCKNKEVPQSTCNGKCFLKDKLDVATSSSEEESEAVIPTWSLTEYEVPGILTLITDLPYIVKENSEYQYPRFDLHFSGIFKPPI